MAASTSTRFPLRQDRTGMVWDLLLYVPTVVALASMAAKLWFDGQQSLAYLLSFLASFFAIAGANRILKTRLLLLPSAPIVVEIEQDVVRIVQRNGSHSELVKEQRFYSDYSGRSFGVSGLDRSGRRLQFVLHKGQFADDRQYDAVQNALRRYAQRNKGPR